MATSIRRLAADDLFDIQGCNLQCLPENYNMRYYFYHALSWAPCLYMASNTDSECKGYVLTKLEEDPAVKPKGKKRIEGHITSLAVLRSARRTGLAHDLMVFAQKGLNDHYNAERCTLHVRSSNRPAFSLYTQSLDYRIHHVERGYYADGEDAYTMELILPHPVT